MKLLLQTCCKHFMVGLTLVIMFTIFGRYKLEVEWLISRLTFVGKSLILTIVSHVDMIKKSINRGIIATHCENSSEYFNVFCHNNKKKTDIELRFQASQFYIDVALPKQPANKEIKAF